MQIRDFTDTDLPAMQTLYKETYNREFPTDRVFWMRQGNPTGPAIWPIAVEQDEYAGQSTSVIVPFRDGDSQTKIVKMQNAMVSPKFRGRHVYSDIVQAKMDRADAAGYSYVYGFPNANSHKAFVGRYGFALICEIPSLGIKREDITEEPDPGLTFEVSGPSSFTVEDANLFAGFSSQVRFRIDRTVEYLNWRYEPASGHTYFVVRGFENGQLVSIAVAKYYEDASGIDIVELACPTDRRHIHALLQALVAAVGDREVDGIEIWCFGGNPLVAAIAEAGFKPTGRSTSLIWRSHPDQGAAPAVTNDFLLTMGDSDVY